MTYLIEYDRVHGKLIRLDKYSDDDRLRAADARIELEVELNKHGVLHEVVLLEASSEADLRRTHRRYFEDLSSLATTL
jgi:hypothetical protein